MNNKNIEKPKKKFKPQIPQGWAKKFSENIGRAENALMKVRLIRKK